MIIENYSYRIKNKPRIILLLCELLTQRCSERSSEPSVQHEWTFFRTCWPTDCQSLRIYYVSAILFMANVIRTRNGSARLIGAIFLIWCNLFLRWRAYSQNGSRMQKLATNGRNPISIFYAFMRMYFVLGIIIHAKFICCFGNCQLVLPNCSGRVTIFVAM